MELVFAILAALILFSWLQSGFLWIWLGVLIGGAALIGVVWFILFTIVYAINDFQHNPLEFLTELGAFTIYMCFIAGITVIAWKARSLLERRRRPPPPLGLPPVQPDAGRS